MKMFRKTLSALLSVMLVGATVATATATTASAQTQTQAEEPKYNITDVTKIQKYLVGMIDLTDAEKLFYDADGDGRLSIQDASKIQRELVIQPATKPQKPTEATTSTETTEATDFTQPTEATEPTEPTEPTTAESLFPKKIELSDGEVGLGVGEQFQLKAITDKPTTIRFVSLDYSIVTVDGDGMLTAQGEGKTVVKATTVNGLTAECKIEVRKAPDKVVIDPDELAMGEGESYTVKYITPGAYSNYKNVVWESSDNSVVKVQKSEYVNADITAVGTGTATVTVTTYNGLKASCEITVKPLATKLTLNESELTLGIGEEFDLDSHVPQGTAAWYRLYSSNDPDVASVTESGGIVTAKSSGTAIIKCVLNNGTQATCKLTVKPMARKLTLNESELTLGVGETFDLDSYVPEETAAYYRYYYSSDTEVASVVRAGGLVTAKSPGTAIIKCVLNNGVQTTCRVTVKNLATSVKLNTTKETLKVGNGWTLAASTDGYTSSYTWTSSNPYVVKIDIDHKTDCHIKAMSQGTATITCTTSNGKKATCEITVSGSNVKCLDVSVWQGDIDFDDVKADGYDYVILRAGFGNEASQEDYRFEEYYREARAAGLKIGAYWYSYAVDNDDALREAKACLQVLGNKKLDMPVFYDVEESFQAYYSNQKLSNICKTFCDYIYDNSYYYTGVYTSIGWYSYNVDRDIIGSRHAYWVAQIDGDMSLALDFDVHQYSWYLTVDGINSRVDGNYIYNLNIVR